MTITYSVAVSDAIDGAVTVLEERGLHKGSYLSKLPHWYPKGPPCCTLGAIALGAGLKEHVLEAGMIPWDSVPLAEEVAELVYEAITGHSVAFDIDDSNDEWDRRDAIVDKVAGWTDDPQRTVAEVIDVLVKAKGLLEAAYSV